MKIAQLLIYEVKGLVANDLVVSWGQKQFPWKLEKTEAEASHAKDVVICIFKVHSIIDKMS